MTLPVNTGERVREWAEGEAAKAKEREELLTELFPAMEARGYDTGVVKAAVSG